MAMRMAPAYPMFDKNPFCHAHFTAIEAALFDADLLITFLPLTSQVVLASLKICANPVCETGEYSARSPTER